MQYLHDLVCAFLSFASLPFPIHYTTFQEVPASTRPVFHRLNSWWRWVCQRGCALLFQMGGSLENAGRHEKQLGEWLGVVLKVRLPAVRSHCQDRGGMDEDKMYTQCLRSSSRMALSSRALSSSIQVSQACSSSSKVQGCVQSRMNTTAV